MAHDDVVVSHCCVLDLDTLDSINMTDPRQFSLKHGTHRLLELTSVSWLLPAEPTAVVLTPGVADGGDHCIVASEADHRVSHMPKALFA